MQDKKTKRNKAEENFVNKEIKNYQEIKYNKA